MVDSLWLAICGFTSRQRPSVIMYLTPFRSGGINHVSFFSTSI
jgi:hypothetical protein